MGAPGWLIAELVRRNSGQDILRALVRVDPTLRPGPAVLAALADLSSDIAARAPCTDDARGRVVQIIAGIVAAVMPRFGGLLVAAWRGGVILDLLLIGDSHDIACAASGR